MNSKDKNFYEVEADLFRKNFCHIKDKRIALYGIGRYTSALLPQIRDFNIIGLLDRDDSNIGKIIAGYQVLDIKKVSDIDAIIINTSESYWQIIYKRLEQCGIPVFFRNGEKAHFEEYKIQNIKYWESCEENLNESIISHDIISFDLFETLVNRTVFEPEDIFDIVEHITKNKYGINIDFKSVRTLVLNDFGKDTYNVNDIYNKMHQYANFSQAEEDILKNTEEYIEVLLCEPRKFIVDKLHFAQEKGKDIYVVTDMYLSKDVIKSILKKCGVQLEDNRIIVSAIEGKSKEKGDIWQFFKDTNKRILHIGDNYNADVILPKEYGIDTFYVMGKKELLLNSSIKDVASQVSNFEESVRLGLILNKIFDNPFCLNESKGRLQINDYRQFGYVFYGMILYDFFIWLQKISNQLDISSFVFLARDGYFIKDDYVKFCEEKGFKAQNIEYLAMSRRLIMSVSIINEEDFDCYIKYPYSGTFEEFLFDRFNIKKDDRTANINDKIINPLTDFEEIKENLKKYKKEIDTELKEERENYLRYLRNKNIDEKMAIVDTGYHGTPQMYLTRLFSKNKTQGLYFYTDLNPENECLKTNNMIGCFQKEEDLTAKNCNLMKRIQITESLFTAPHGMIYAVDKDGNFLCNKAGKNQEYFLEREEINQGIISYLIDISKYNFLSECEAIYSDNIYGELIKDGFVFGEKIKEIFYNDDGMIQRREIRFLE